MTSYEEILESAKRLSSVERLQLADALLAEELGLEPSTDRVVLTDAQRQELDSRIEEIDRDENLGIPWDDVVATIRERA